MRLANAVFAVAFATIISLGSAHAVCTNASVVGSYGAILYQGEGYAIHLFHYAADGNGGLSASETRSVGGTIETKADYLWRRERDIRFCHRSQQKRA